MLSKKKDSFAELTWEDLRQWAGEKILSRGRSYQRNGCVKELARSANGGLFAWVTGSERYATHVRLEQGELVAECACPFGYRCKHAVAVVLEYLECLKRRQAVPLAKEDDPRLKRLMELERKHLQVENDDKNEEEYDEEAAGAPSSGNTSWKSILDSQSKEELIHLIGELAEKNPEVRGILEDRAGLSKGTVGRMVKSIRQEIRNLSSEPGWSNYWKGEGYTPDYSRVKERMESLLVHGHADEVVRLGEELLEGGTSQVGMSHDDGDTAMEISSCLEVAFEALSKSSLSPLDRMLWAIDAELKDEYNLCEGVGIFWEQKHSRMAWGQLADMLLARLKEYPVLKGEDDFSRKYKRDALSNWIIRALEESGRHKEVIPLCEKEAVKTASYGRLVEYLMQTKRWKEAEEWIRKGIRDTEEKYPGIASKLRTNLKDIWAKGGAWHMVAALEADEFIRTPSLRAYKDLQKAATRAKLWLAVKPVVMKYLETGKSWEEEDSWPLPETGLCFAEPRWRPEFPMIGVLIDIAISEKNTEDVLRWHNSSKTKGRARGFGGLRDKEVAEAVVSKYPDLSISIWKELAENQIGFAKPNAYYTAAGYLRKIHSTLNNNRREKEWHDYVGSLRSLHARKRKLLEILSGLDGKRIVDG
jgi:uncharacterized Zn finger protein